MVSEYSPISPKNQKLYNKIRKRVANIGVVFLNKFRSSFRILLTISPLWYLVTNLPPPTTLIKRENWSVTHMISYPPPPPPPPIVIKGEDPKFSYCFGNVEPRPNYCWKDFAIKNQRTPPIQSPICARKIAFSLELFDSKTFSRWNKNFLFESINAVFTWQENQFTWCYLRLIR